MPGETAERRLKRRSAVRVIVLAGDEILLQGDTDPGLPGSRFWQTPGGGVDAGESLTQAAVREVAEETGLDVDPAHLEGPVATRRVTHGYSDRVLIQHETFFRVRTGRFEPDATGLTDAEKQRRVTTQWFAMDELPEPLWPAELGRLASHEGTPIDLGDVEESTVPVS